jgi:hypothetical protein
LGRDLVHVLHRIGGARTTGAFRERLHESRPLGLVWTAPALQEQSDVRLAVGRKACVRPLCGFMTAGRTKSDLIVGRARWREGQNRAYLQATDGQCSLAGDFLLFEHHVIE